MDFVIVNGLGQEQSAGKPVQSKGKEAHDNDSRVDSVDSGYCDSFRSHIDSVEEDNARQTSVESLASIEERHETPSISHELRETPSLNQELQKLQIQDQPQPPQQPPQQPKKERKVITLAQLRARTKEQALRDFASYDFGTTEEIKEKPKPEVIDPRICASLIAEVERPPQFEQDADGDT
jgi:hypothetical protein